MKKVYDLKLINDYIEGNDIKDYNVEELENDYNFMIGVIKTTKDKNIYNLCSDEVKNNYEFVKFIINYFKDDIAFIDGIADKYLLNHRDEEYNYMDIAVNMIKLTKNDQEFYNKYYLFAKFFYVNYMVEAKIDINEANLSHVLGEGFLIARDDFDGNTDILDFFAVNLINDIFFANDKFNLTKYIHEKFSDFSRIEENGVTNYILKLLEGHDRYLAEYVSKHVNTLSRFKEEMDDIKNSWDKFNKNNENKRYDLIFESVHNYIVYSEPYCTLGELEALYYVSDDLGIVDKVKELEGISDEDYQELMGYKEFIVSGMSDNERKHYNNIKNIVSDILSEKVVDDSRDSYTIDNGKNKSKVLRVDFKNKNVNYL